MTHKVIGKGKVLRSRVDESGAVRWYINGTAVSRRAIVAEYGEYPGCELASDRLARIGHKKGGGYDVLKNLGEHEGLFDPASVTLTTEQRQATAGMLYGFGVLRVVADRFNSYRATSADMRIAAEVQRFVNNPLLTCLAPDLNAPPVNLETILKRILDIRTQRA